MIEKAKTDRLLARTNTEVTEEAHGKVNVPIITITTEAPGRTESHQAVWRSIIEDDTAPAILVIGWATSELGASTDFFAQQIRDHPDKVFFILPEKLLTDDGHWGLLDNDPRHPALKAGFYPIPGGSSVNAWEIALEIKRMCEEENLRGPDLIAAVQQAFPYQGRRPLDEQGQLPDREENGGELGKHMVEEIKDSVV